MTPVRTIIDWLDEPDRQVIVPAGQKILYILPVIESVPTPRQREIVLSGPGAEADVLGLWLGSADDQLNLALNTTHAAPNTRGNTVFKAVLGGRAALEFKGMIKINSGAQGSNDFLQQDSLLLSQDAKANSVPGLEIEANDVKASHGATAKPVDVEQMFYLMSRGLSAEQAEAMVVMGFINPVLKLIAEADLKKKILATLQNNFHLADILA